MGLFDDIAKAVDDAADGAEEAGEALVSGIAGSGAADAADAVVGELDDVVDKGRDAGVVRDVIGGAWTGSVEDVMGAIDGGQPLDTVLPRDVAFELPNTPATPPGVPLPYPNVDFDVELPDPGPVTVGFGQLGEGTIVPVIGPPDVLLDDPEYVDTPDVSFDAGDVHTTVSLDPLAPGGRTAHGGVTVGGMDVTVGVDAPGIDAEVDVESVTTVDPMVTGIVPHVGGEAVGGSATVDLQPDEIDLPPVPDVPDVEVAPPPPDDGPSGDFADQVDAIDDAADSLDIFD